MKKYLNGYLVAGGIIVFLLLLMIVMPSFFTDNNPYTTNILDSYTDQNGDFKLKTAPFEPDEDYLLGTDDSGRDVLSFIIYGTRLTIAVALMVTFLRFFFALLFGISAGFNNSISKMLIEQFNHVFNAIPPVLMCILVLNIPYLKTLTKSTSTMIFILILTLVEWAKTGNIIEERVIALRKKDFIKSEIVIGKSNLHIVFSNIIPHLLPELFVLFFMEIARVLTVLMQLGIFNIFIGNLRIVSSTDQGVTVGKATSYEPEWSSMLGSAKNYIRTAPWTVFSSAGAFFLVVLGFNMIGEGLRLQLQKYSVSQMSQKSAVRGLTALLLVCTLITGPVVFSSLKYTGFDYSNSQEVHFTASEALVGNPTQISYVTSRLKDMGIEPLKEGTDFALPFEPVSYQWLFDYQFKIGNQSVENFALHSYSSHEGQAQVIDARLMDLIAPSKAEQAQLKGQYVLIDKNLYGEGGWLYYADKLINDFEVKGVFILSDEPKSLNRMGTHLSKGIILEIPAQFEAQLLSEPISLDFNLTHYENTLTNIVGKIQGHPDKNEPEAILLSFNLNYQNRAEGEARFRFVFNLIEQLKAHEDQLTKSIIIIFWDGVDLGEHSGKAYYKNNFYYAIKNTEFYVELTDLDFTDTFNSNGIIKIDTGYISNVKPVASNFTNLLTENIKKARYSLKNTALTTFNKEPFFFKWGIPTLYLSYENDTAEKSMPITEQTNPITVETFGDLLIESIVFELY